MNLQPDLFSGAWHVFAALCGLGVALWIARTAPWRRLLDGHQLNAILGAAVILTLLWSLNAGVYPGLNLHLLGAMAATLIFGPQLALVVLGLALAGVTLNGSVEWGAYPINFLVMGVIPVAFGSLYFTLIERWLPRHFFVYIFVNAFIGAAVIVRSRASSRRWPSLPPALTRRTSCCPSICLSSCCWASLKPGCLAWH